MQFIIAKARIIQSSYITGLFQAGQLPQKDINLYLSSYNRFYLLLMGAEGSYIEEKIVNGQKLVKVNQQEMKTEFHRWIGALVSKDGFERPSKGSAVLLSKNIILTAAHNLYDKEYEGTNSKHTNFRFYPGPCGVVESYHPIEDNTWRYPPQFETCSKQEKSTYDYALMRLKDGLDMGGQQASFLPLSLTCLKCGISELQRIKLQIYGYPYHDSLTNYTPHNKDQTKIELWQYGLSRHGLVQFIDPKSGRIHYGISTLGGQSGCPLIANNKVIGIHIGGGKQGEFFNLGRLLTPGMLENLQKWCKQLNGQGFKIHIPQACEHIPEILLNKEPITNQQDILGDNLSLELQDVPVGEAELSDHSEQIKDALLKSWENVLDLSYKRVVSINISRHNYLRELYLVGCNLANIDLMANVHLTHLQLQNNHIKQIDLSMAAKLSTLYLSCNQLQSIDLRENKLLTDLWLHQNQLTEIDLTNNTLLVLAIISGNQLQVIDLKNNKELTHLGLSFNGLSEIDLTANQRITNLQAKSNKLGQILLWFSGQLSLERSKKSMMRTLDLGNQKSASCNITLMHRKAQSQRCQRFKDMLQDEYSGKKCWSRQDYERDVNQFKSTFSVVLSPK